MTLHDHRLGKKKQKKKKVKGGEKLTEIEKNSSTKLEVNFITAIFSFVWGLLSVTTALYKYTAIAETQYHSFGFLRSVKISKTYKK